jgi:hypothetical protein
MIVIGQQIKPLALKYISSSGCTAAVTVRPEHCVQMMAQRRGILTNDEVWQWFVFVFAQLI